MRIKLFEAFVKEEDAYYSAMNSGKKIYKTHPLGKHVLTKEEAVKLGAFEEENLGPGDDPFTQKEFDDFVAEVTGKTIAEFCEWKWPDEPQEQFKLTLEILKMEA